MRSSSTSLRLAPSVDRVDTLLTLIVAALGAVAALVTALANFRRAGRVERKVDQVHGLVNGQLDRAVGRADQLAATMTEAGVPVPPPPPPPGAPPP